MSQKTVVGGLIKTGVYYDSVSLMKMAQSLRDLPGVIDSAAVMGSPGNKAILESAGLMTEEFSAAGENDLLIMFSVEKAEDVNRITNEIEYLLNSLKTPASPHSGPAPKTIAGAPRTLPDANLALISVAGRYAGDEARKALQAGMHVMLFSDNVSLNVEIELKKLAVSKGLLLMGPDCGTAIINGVPLGFANAVSRGDIGIVAASGTGLQEVSCIISNAGAGISQAIGTGSRDIGAEVAGIMFIEGLKALLNDEPTRVLLIISKPPHISVLEKISSALKSNTKPVVTVFLGADNSKIQQRGIYAAATLEEGALIAVSLSKNIGSAEVTARLNARDAKLIESANTEIARVTKGQRYIRGLFSGGTFCYEAQVLLSGILSPIRSNSPFGANLKLTNILKSEGHTLVDMGADEFTVGRLHPMIDYSLRNRRILDEARDPESAVILLDIVLGFGAHEDPLSEIVPTIEDAKKIARQGGRYLPVVCSVTGTDGDPQRQSAVISGLKRAGVIVAESNASACKLAGFIAKGAAQQ